MYVLLLEDGMVLNVEISEPMYVWLYTGERPLNMVYILEIIDIYA